MHTILNPMLAVCVHAESCLADTKNSQAAGVLSPWVGCVRRTRPLFSLAVINTCGGYSLSCLTVF